jgi:hypothetical protein
MGTLGQYNGIRFILPRTFVLFRGKNKRGSFKIVKSLYVVTGEERFHG